MANKLHTHNPYQSNIHHIAMYSKPNQPLLVYVQSIDHPHLSDSARTGTAGATSVLCQKDLAHLSLSLSTSTNRGLQSGANQSAAA